MYSATKRATLLAPVLLLFALTVAAEAQRGIVSADYGAGHRRQNVTGRVQSMVQNGLLNFRVGNDTLGGDPAPAVVGWARDYEKAGNEAAGRALLSKGLHAYPQNEEIARALAVALFRARECRSGIDALSHFEASSTNPGTFNVLALLQTCLENRAEVVRLLRRSLELDPNQPEVAQSLRRAEGQ